LETEAAARGRSLLTLDTRTGDAAEPLYAGLGFQTAGVIPGYCRDTLSDRMDPTTIMWKAL
ncbi:GNAT family N-acetyltransferase, partial [Amaricoccus sp. HAR-UPW-R2A-40]